MRNKTYTQVFALLLLTVAVSVCGYAQSKTKHILKTDKGISVGFQTGRELLFNSTPLIHSKQSKVHYGISKSLVLRKALNSHFKIESGLSYTSIQSASKGLSLPGKLNNSPYNYSVPVTIQYHFLPEKCKFHPFCGAGIQGNFFNNKNDFSTSPIGMDVATPQNNYPQADTKYITILFTQGVTFEVNTKIELTQSFHFIPTNTTNIIGIDLGIGYKIP